jgi:methylisocitrate lyase
MIESMTPGERFREAVELRPPVQVVGAVNAYTAMLAARTGFEVIYLSGSGVATASYGLPDLGLTSLDHVLEDVRRITGACETPLLVDADTGWGSAANIARTVQELSRAGAAALHLEDQVEAKRCGHRPNKALVEPAEMVERLQAAVSAREDDSFCIMARTDAYASEGLDAAIERALAYREAGADMIFAEALEALSDYQAFTNAVQIPVLANITEFGRTPIFTREELARAGVSLVLYPLSAFRAMSAAAEDVYASILREGSQQDVLDRMQTREELYEVLHYHEYENQMDHMLKKRDPS